MSKIWSFVFCILIVINTFYGICHAADQEMTFWNGIPYTLEIGKEQLPHECGVALIRLRKPIAYYAKQYNDPSWGLKKLLVLMEKQRHRGQDGAGIAAVKFDVPTGHEYMHRLRFASKNGLDHILEQASADMQSKEPLYLGEVMLGHVRYATHSGLDVGCCQPFLRSHSVAGRNIIFAGNFNMTNTTDILTQLQEWGLSPISDSDTQIILESFTYQLDRQYEIMARKSNLSGRKAIEDIAQNLDLVQVLKNASAHWDGGFVFCGVLGNGDAFCCRDAAGIRPGFVYLNDDIFAVASERVVLMDTFDIQAKDVVEIKPGHVIVVKRDGAIIQNRFSSLLPEKQCSFERIYFSKASDPQIYQERKNLGRNMAQRVYAAINGDLENTVFTYVPNSSQPAFQGLLDEIAAISGKHGRSEVLVAKSQKIRTFISSDQERVEAGLRIYDITHGAIKPGDTLVVVDDSLVRGATFRDFLMKKLSSLNPKNILLVISAPPVLYPDCYGIDMSQLGRFVAFQAAIDIRKERKQDYLLQEINTLALQQNKLSANKMHNVVKKIYDGITEEELSKKIAQLITPKDINWHGEFNVIFQTLDGLHNAIPNYAGDWYFSGDYPTAGGYKVLNTAYLNWFGSLDVRSY